MPGKSRTKQMDAKRSRKSAMMANGKGKSNYGRKHAFLKTHGGSGTDYPDKPWRVKLSA